VSPAAQRRTSSSTLDSRGRRAPLAVVFAWWSGKTVAMTAMPQMVALYNGMGGGAAGAIAAVRALGNKANGVTRSS